MNAIKPNSLCTATEYFVRCVKCDAESTRDSLENFAVNLATQEGFVVGRFYAVYCASCAAEIAASEACSGCGHSITKHRYNDDPNGGWASQRQITDPRFLCCAECECAGFQVPEAVTA